MTDDNKSFWDKVKEGAAEYEKQQALDDLVKAAEESRAGGRHKMTDEEKRDLKQYVSADIEKQKYKNNKANRDVDKLDANSPYGDTSQRSLEDKGYTQDEHGSWYDPFGRECDSNGNRY